MLLSMLSLFCLLFREDDNNWPQPDKVGRQELEIVMGKEHISFTVCKVLSFVV